MDYPENRGVFSARIIVAYKNTGGWMSFRRVKVEQEINIPLDSAKNLMADIRGSNPDLQIVGDWKVGL